MNIMIGDTIVTEDREIGIVENRDGNFLTVRFPDCGNQRDQVPRRRAKPLAELICEARGEGKRLTIGTAISLVGASPLADLVALFGYSTGQMRRDSLQKVVNQLLRAGLLRYPLRRIDGAEMTGSKSVLLQFHFQSTTTTIAAIRIR